MKFHQFLPIFLLILLFGCEGEIDIYLTSALNAGASNGPEFFTESYSLGSGTLIDPYIISKPAHLKYLSETTADWDKHFRLDSDVNFSLYDNSVDYKTMLPIGRYDRGTDTCDGFSGTFDGNSRTISNLNLSNSLTDNSIALFGCIENSANIHHLKLDNIDVDGNHYAGILAGRSYESDISDIEITNSSINATGDRSGAIVGEYRISNKVTSIENIVIDNFELNTPRGISAAAFGWIDAVDSTLDIDNINITNSEINNGASTTGVLSSYLRSEDSDITVQNVNIDAVVSTDRYSSLFIGTVSTSGTSGDVIFDKISIEGTLNFSGASNGGLIGALGMCAACTIDVTKSSVKATLNSLSGSGVVGGLMGQTQHSGVLRIIDSYADVDLNYSADSGTKVGMLVGRDQYGSGTTELENTYATGSITGRTGAVGGLVGHDDGNVTYLNSYWLGDGVLRTLRAANTGGTTGELDSTQINNQASFTGFDFTGVWSINENVSSPELR